MDAFTSLFSVPFQLTTLEAVREIKRVLTDNGVVIFNLGGAVSGPGSGFFLAELNTYKEVFPHVLVFKVDPDKDDSEVQNLVFIAFEKTTPSRQNLSSEYHGMGHLWLFRREQDNESRQLVDDLAPVARHNFRIPHD